MDYRIVQCRCDSDFLVWRRFPVIGRMGAIVQLRAHYLRPMLHGHSDSDKIHFIASVQHLIDFCH